MGCAVIAYVYKFVSDYFKICCLSSDLIYFNVFYFRQLEMFGFLFSYYVNLGVVNS